jgi:hypothetical protein
MGRVGRVRLGGLVAGRCWLAGAGVRAWRFQRRRWDRVSASPAQLQKNLGRWGLTRVEERSVASACLGGRWEERRNGGTLNAERLIFNAEVFGMDEWRLRGGAFKEGFYRIQGTDVWRRFKESEDGGGTEGPDAASARPPPTERWRGATGGHEAQMAPTERRHSTGSWHAALKV